jgi:hypothetical protein
MVAEVAPDLPAWVEKYIGPPEHASSRESPETRTLFSGFQRRTQKTADWLAADGEIELPVPFRELQDDNSG